MDVKQVRERKQELGKAITDLLEAFERETEVSVSDVTFVRQEPFDKDTWKEGFHYVVEVGARL